MEHGDTQSYEDKKLRKTKIDLNICLFLWLNSNDSTAKLKNYEKAKPGEGRIFLNVKCQKVFTEFSFWS